MTALRATPAVLRRLREEAERFREITTGRPEEIVARLASTLPLLTYEGPGQGG